MLDEGQRNDWFSSRFIVVFAAVSALSLAALVLWEASRKAPIVDVRLIGQRQFGTCFLMMLLIGGILVGTTQIVPQLLQTTFGYTATLAGIALSPGGMAMFVLMPVAGFLTTKVQPKYLVVIGLVLMACAMWYPTGLTDDITFGYTAWLRVLMALGLPFLFLPLTTASYSGLPPSKTNQAAALFNVARNLGGTIGISMVQTLLIRRGQHHQARWVETLNPLNPNYVNHTDQATQVLIGQGQPPKPVRW